MDKFATGGAAPAALSSVAFLALAGVAAALICLGLAAVGRKAKGTPSPPGHGPVLENTVEVLANMPRFLDWLLDLSRKYGGEDGLGTWSFRVALQPRMTIVHDPDNVRHVLQNVNIYGKGPVWRANFYPILGDGIFSADFDNWLTQRKRAANMFKVSNFKHSMLEAVRGKSLKTLGLLEAQVRSASPASAPRPTAVVELQELFFKMTLDTIGEIAFGQDLGSLSGKNVEFMQAFDYCQQYANDLFFKPGPAWAWNNLTPEGWTFQKQAKVLSTYGAALVKDMITRSLQEEAAAAAAAAEGLLDDDDEHGNGHAHKETILSYFLQKESPASLNDPRTLHYLTDVIMNFQIAGRDTVAQAFSWSVHMLSLHPAVQEKIYQEARSVLGSSAAAAATASFEQIQRLEYTHAVVTEVLRLYPSVPKEGKWAYQDDVLPDGTHVGKGTWVLFVPYVMGRLEALWADAGAFKPERHLDKPKPSSFVFTAFQGGPRICLGQNLAYMQLQYGLALLMLSCELAPVDGGKHVKPVQKSATMPMQAGVPVHVTLRSEG